MRGHCNICGRQAAFYSEDPTLYRESLNCSECRTTSRYRSIARGLLRAIGELAKVRADSLQSLPHSADARLSIYDTQRPFYYATTAYPIPDLLARCPWIDVHTSVYRPGQAPGSDLGSHVTVQNLEKLTFPDNSFDVVITSDVMEHVRLDDRAHAEIARVLNPGGVYLFTVPHFRHQRDTLTRVKVVDPADSSKDEFVLEPEYHGDANSDGGGALSFRAYGTEIDETLRRLGFDVEYEKEDFPEAGILNTELFYCRLADRR